MTQQSDWNPPLPRSQQDTVQQIALWGAPQSGKTTFLSALKIAVETSGLDMRLIGRQDASTHFLSNSTELLLYDRLFPSATEAVQWFTWILSWNGGPQRPQPTQSWNAALPADELATIEVLDAPGRLYGTGRQVPQSRDHAANVRLGDGGDPQALDNVIIENLIRCGGVLLLIDPMEERKSGSAYRYFHPTLDKLAQRLLSSGGRLPHKVAVVATKFDDPEVYSHAQRYSRAQSDEFNLFERSQPHFPRISGDHAERFLLSFCRESQVSRMHLFTSALRRYFQEDRIRFFVTSSIGFYVDPVSGVFDENDYQNTVKQDDRTVQVRGDINPVNVLEPLLWLSGWTEGRTP